MICNLKFRHNYSISFSYWLCFFILYRKSSCWITFHWSLQMICQLFLNFVCMCKYLIWTLESTKSYGGWWYIRILKSSKCIYCHFNSSFPMKHDLTSGSISRAQDNEMVGALIYKSDRDAGDKSRVGI